MAGVIPIKVVRTGGDTSALAEFNTVDGDFIHPSYLPSIASQGGVGGSHLTDTNPHGITAAMLDAATISDLNGHTTNLNVHRQINDASTANNILWSGAKITTMLATKSPTAHDHNTIYYTQSQLDTKFNTTGAQVKTGADDTNAGYLYDKMSSGQGTTVVTSGANPNKKVQVNAKVFTSTINGQVHPVFIDSSRASILSTTMTSFLFAENQISANEWIKIGRATDADSGYIMPFDCTVVAVTAHCENCPPALRNFSLYNNGSLSNLSFVTFTNGTNKTYESITEDIHFSKGDRMRIRGDSNTTIYDTVFTVFVRWRA